MADLAKANNTVLTFPEEMHMRRLVWRWGETEDRWLTKVHFGDRPAACGLEVAKRLIAEAGADINPEAVEMLKKSYVNDIICGSDEDAVDRVIGNETWSDGVPSYDGTLQQIYDKASFRIKVMVRNKESCHKVIKLLGGGVLGLPWDPEHDLIPFHMGIRARSGWVLS